MFGPFSEDVRVQKYAWDMGSRKETWEETSRRVASSVLGALRGRIDEKLLLDLVDQVTELIRQRKFLPGGRYLAQAGREWHQVNNCLLLRTEECSSEEWANVMHRSVSCLMSGAGIGINYSNLRPEGTPLKRKGGFSTGPIALMNMVNEAGRFIMQGGSRRSAIWAGLRWSHADQHKFIQLKNWPKEIRDLKAKDFNFPAPMDMTNISTALDDEFFDAYHDTTHPQHAYAQSVYWAAVERMLKTGEPGFSIDLGPNAGEDLRNAPVTADTYVLTDHGYRRVGELVGRPVTIWTGKQYAEDVVFTKTASNAPIVQVQMTGGRVIRCEPNHEFLVEVWDGKGMVRRHLERIERVKAKDLQEGDILHVSLPEVSVGDVDASAYTLGYMYGDGSFSGDRGEITFCTDESKACVDRIRSCGYLKSVTHADSRGYTRAYFRSEYLNGRSKEEFPEHVYRDKPDQMASFVAGLFDADGNYEPTQKRIRLASKHEGFLRGVARVLERLGILAGVTKAGISTYGKSQGYQLVVMADHASRFAEIIPTIRIKPDLVAYAPFRQSKIKVLSVEEDGFEDVFCADVKVEEHSFMAEGVIISNCTEVTSADDSDVCNLGSINLARIDSLEEMQKVTELATIFLLAGTLYSDLPYEKVKRVREKNRRLGLGVMGLHEWLLLHGKKYGPDAELGQYLEIYGGSTFVSWIWADRLGISRPVKTRAIAPTGTIGILAETTTGIEPIFCAAYKRRYLKHKTWHYQYVIDPIVTRLVEEYNADPDSIEDAYSISPERRVDFQVWVQQYVDHGISSTINIPAWGSEENNESKVKEFGNMLITRLPKLRGITCYPDGARNGQPLVPVKYHTALKHLGTIFEEAGEKEKMKPFQVEIPAPPEPELTDAEAGRPVDLCDITKGGTCGA